MARGRVTGKALIAGGAFVSSALNFLTILVWARLLAPEEYGIYALVASWGLLLNGTVFEWLRQTLSRNIYDTDRTYRPEGLSPVFALYLAVTVALALAYLLSFAIFTELSDLLFWIFLFGVAEGSFVIAVTLHTIYARAKRYFVSVVGRGLATPVVSLPLIQHMDDKGIAVASSVIGVSLTIAVLNLLFEPAMRCFRLSEVNRTNLTNTVHFGLPLAFSASTNALSGQIDRILVGAILGPTVLGVYAVICDVAQKPISVLMTAINTVAYPYYLRATERSGLNEGFKRLNESGNYLVAATFGVPLVCVLFGDLALRFFYSEDIPDFATTVFGVAAATALMRGLLGAFYYPAFQLARETKTIMVISVILMVLTLSATSIGGLTIGVYGVALGSLVAVAVAVGVAHYRLHKLGTAGLFNRRNLMLTAAHSVWVPVFIAIPWERIAAWWVPPLVYVAFAYGTVGAVLFRGLRQRS